MIDELLSLAATPDAERELQKLVGNFVRALHAPAHGGDRGLVERAEAEVRGTPDQAFAYDSDGIATLTGESATWSAGRFTTPSIGELRARIANGIDDNPSDTRLWVFDGVSPATDIGGLQANADGHSMFQVASQFNCLEAPGPFIVPVSHYLSDPTQGPRAAISAFPAALLRHYRAPSGDGSFVQETDARQIDLLADVFAPGRSPVRNGYLLADDLDDATSTALEERFDHIRIGVHTEAAVVLGYDWDGAVIGRDRLRIAQAFTSTAAAGMYGRRRGETGVEPACRQLLRAAYLGTLLAAIVLERSTVVLTLIGGGVFGNPHAIIWDAILDAYDEAAPSARRQLDVIVNGRNLGETLEPETILAAVRSRGGAVLQFGPHGLLGVAR